MCHRVWIEFACFCESIYNLNNDHPPLQVVFQSVFDYSFNDCIEFAAHHENSFTSRCIIRILIRVCHCSCLHGTCTNSGTCICDAGWQGSLCSIPVCASGCDPVCFISFLILNITELEPLADDYYFWLFD